MGRGRQPRLLRKDTHIMNKLNDTKRANVKVLEEGELSQVVGGRGRHGGWGGNNGGRRGGGNGGGQLRRLGGGGGGGGGNTFNITINVFNF